jgi:hypothetical protein
MGFNTELLLGDKQSQKPVDYLFSIVEKLPTETPSQKGIKHYIKLMKKYYMAFTSETMEKIEREKY